VSILTDKKFGLTEGILLGVITILGYSFTYFFEVGFKGYYHIPDDYVEIGITNVIKNVSYILFGLIFILGIINSLLSGIPKTNISFQDYRYYNAAIMFASLFLGVMFSKFNLYSIIVALLFYGYSIYKDFFLSKKKTFTNDTPYSPVTIITKKYGFKAFLIMYCIIFIVALMPNIEMLGSYAAQQQKSYLIIRQPKDMVVLGTYRDNVIAAEVDLNKKEITAVFKFIKSKSLEAEMVETGKLKVVTKNSVTNSVYK
jgi:hypothetical protein